MAAVRSTELHGVLQPHLERVRDLTSLTTMLAVLDDTAVLHLDSARSYKTGQGEVARIVASGSRRPLHCTSVGKLLLAHLSTTQQRDLLPKITLHKYAPKTLVNKHTLRKHLDEVFEAGIATADEESADGTCSIAAPICRRGHVVAALAIESRGPHALADGRRPVPPRISSQQPSRLGPPSTDDDQPPMTKQPRVPLLDVGRTASPPVSAALLSQYDGHPTLPGDQPGSRGKQAPQRSQRRRLSWTTSSTDTPGLGQFCIGLAKRAWWTLTPFRRDHRAGDRTVHRAQCAPSALLEPHRAARPQ